MEIKASRIVLKSSYCHLSFAEDHEQACLHIWVHNPDYASIEVDGNHIRVSPQPPESQRKE